MRRLLTAKCHTASYLGSPFMSHPLPNGNRLSPRQLDLISHSPGNSCRWLLYIVLSMKFFQMKIYSPWAGLGRILAVACAATQKHWCLKRPVGRLPRQTCKSHLCRKQFKMADNGVEPRTSTTVIMRTFSMPTPHVASQLASVILRVWSIARGNWLEIGFTGPAMWWSLFLWTPRQINLSGSILSTCNWTSPKSDWAAPVTLTKKGRKVSKTWWGEWIIGRHKLEQEVSWSTSFTALMRRLLTAKCHTASYLGSPFMSHQLPNGNRLSPRQLDLISHSPGNSCTCSMKFFQMKYIALGRILAVACATTQKHWCPKRPGVSVGRLS